jgi:quinol monooxygenase YgiN
MLARMLGLAALLFLVLPAPTGAQEKDDPIVAFVKTKVKDRDKPFTLLVTVKVKEGMGAKFEEAFAKAIQGTRKEKGCIRYDLNRSLEDATKYQVYERWKTVADLEAHLKTEHIKALREVLPDVLTGAPELGVMLPASE